MEVAAKIAKRDFCRERGVPESEVGVFYITPCSAKNTYIHHSPGQAETALTAHLHQKRLRASGIGMHTPAGKALRRAGRLEPAGEYPAGKSLRRALRTRLPWTAFST
jgi:hypothetical protein